MKARYRFSVEGLLKLDPKQMLPISDNGFVYEFVLNDLNMVTHIQVTVPVAEEWYPKYYEDSSGRSVLDTTNPALNFIHRNLKGIEALMSIWSLKSIDKNSYDIKWLPENAEEKQKLLVSSQSFKAEKQNPEDIEPLSYDFVARSVISSWAGAKLSTITGFYRKGTFDIYDGEFIDSIYDFYMILESLYGDGKWRGKDVKRNLKATEELKNAFYEVTNNLGHYLRPKLLNQYNNHEHYSTGLFEDAIDHFVDLRGSLHHHSEKNPNAWDPNKPENYELDALILFALCGKIIFKKIWLFIDDESVKEQYNKQCSEFLAKYA